MNLTKLSTVQKAPKWTFGTKTTPPHVPSTPGPGQYSVDSSYIYSSPPRVAMLTASRSPPQIISDVPGPGAYNPPERTCDITCAIRGKPHYPVSNGIPGPGTYTPATIASPSFHFAQSARDFHEKIETPGPGTYSPSPLDESRRIVMLSSPRVPPTRSVLSPGPGSYETKTSFGEGHAFSLFGKRKDPKVPPSPGPATYEVHDEITHPTLPSYHFQGAPKHTTVSTFSPGPAAYEIKEDLVHTIAPNVKFSKTARGKAYKTFVEQEKSKPGPGEYKNLKSRFDDTKIAYSFSHLGHSTEIKKSNLPGPGEYAIRDQVTSRRGNFSKGEKSTFSDLTVRKKRGEPGPGQYNVAGKKTYGQKNNMCTAEITFTKDRRFRWGIKEMAPGPGKYEVSSSFDRKKCFTIGLKRDQGIRPVNHSIGEMITTFE